MVGYRGRTWLHEHGEKLKKRKSNETQDQCSTTKKKKLSNNPKNIQMRGKQRQQKSPEKPQRSNSPGEGSSGLEKTQTAEKPHVETEDTPEQKPNLQQVRLSFKWTGKGEGYHIINAAPHERIIDALQKSPHFTKNCKSSSNVIIFCNTLKAIINPSVPCGALAKEEKLDLSQNRQMKKPRKFPETPAYSKGPHGLFFKVMKSGQTPGKAPRKILHNKKQGSDYNTPLAVFGYEDETIQEALHNDKRFKKVNALYIEGTKLEKYELGVTLSDLPVDDTYTIVVKDSGGTVTNTGSQEEGAGPSPIPTTHPDNDASGELTEPEAYRKITEKLRDHFEEYVKRNKGPIKSWQILKENFSNNMRKVPLIATSMRRLTQHMNSIAIIIIEVSATESSQGTCFALTDDLFLTCHHVVEKLVGKTHCKAKIGFNYEDENVPPNYQINVYDIEIRSYSVEHDYAIFSVNMAFYPEGLLPYLALSPEDGIVSIIGHPEHRCKQFDLCSVVNFFQREAVIDETVSRDPSFIHVQKLDRFTEMDDPSVVSYNSCLYHGASGSPVFNEKGQLVAMHSLGYIVGGPYRKKSVIEFGRSIVNIIIYASVEIAKLRIKFKEIYEKNQSLQNYFTQGSHPVSMQPAIRRLIELWKEDENPDINYECSVDSPMDTSI